MNVDKLAIAFMDGFTDGNAQWDENFPDYHKDKYRQGVLCLLREMITPSKEMILSAEEYDKYNPNWSDPETTWNVMITQAIRQCSELSSS